MGTFKFVNSKTRKNKMKLFAFLAGAALAEFNGQPTGGERPCEFYKMTATAIFDHGSTEDVGAAMYNGASQVTGTVTLTQSSCGGGVHFEGTINGLADGKHGWHVHTLGNSAAGCGKSFTGGHWNPFNAPLGAVSDGRKKREVGQIGNVDCSGGSCNVDVTDNLIRLHGLRNVVGRSLVIHQNEDGGATGGSGARVACATIMWGADHEEA